MNLRVSYVNIGIQNWHQMSNPTGGKEISNETITIWRPLISVGCKFEIFFAKLIIIGYKLEIFRRVHKSN